MTPGSVQLQPVGQDRAVEHAGPGEQLAGLLVLAQLVAQPHRVGRLTLVEHDRAQPVDVRGVAPGKDRGDDRDFNPQSPDVTDGVVSRKAQQRLNQPKRPDDRNFDPDSSGGGSQRSFEQTLRDLSKKDEINAQIKKNKPLYLPDAWANVPEESEVPSASCAVTTENRLDVVKN